MSLAIEKYLDRIMAIASIKDADKKASVRAELEDHLLEKIDSLCNEGLSREDAIFKAIEDNGNPVVLGYKLREWAWIDVRLKGTARGVIAIGPKAKGIIALGGYAQGIVAFGGFALGIFSSGGFALGLLFALGGFSLGAISYGGIAGGLLAFGGLTYGVIAAGGMSFGLWVPGAGVVGYSYFGYNNAPDFLKILDDYISYNSDELGLRQTFFTYITTLNLVFWFIFILMSVFQTVMMRKERKRLNDLGLIDI